MLKSLVENGVLSMKDFYMNHEKISVTKLKKQILEDSKNFDRIVIICLGEYDENLGLFGKMASKVGTLLSKNQFVVFGDELEPIKIDKKITVTLSREIADQYPNSFELVVIY